MNITFREIDRAIWTKELDDFIPERIIDFHSHIFNLKYLPSGLSAKSGLFKKFSVYGLRRQSSYDEILFSGRKVNYLVTGWPYVGSDIKQQNDYVRRETRRHGESWYLMLVEPCMEPAYITREIEERGVSGFKPYKCYSRRAPDDSRVTDFLPAEQIAIANRYGLVVTLHLSIKSGIANNVNFRDILTLSDKYPDVIWNMAHCGRSFIPASLENICGRLRSLNGRNIYFDTAAVSDNEVFNMFLSEIGPGRMLYGSDNPIGLLRGRCVELGYDWLFVTEDRFPIASAKESFGGIEPTFMLYEELRTLRRACRKANLSKKDIADIFYNNAANILSGKR